MRFLRSSSVRHTGTDYSAAVANAVAWLGKRYLLATAAPRLNGIERDVAEPGEKAARTLSATSRSRNDNALGSATAAGVGR